MRAACSFLLPLAMLGGCAFTAEDQATSPALATVPRTMNARALGYGVFLPSCILFCVATGQASQAEHGDAQAGDLTTNADVAIRPPHATKPKMKPRMIGKGAKP